MFIKVYKVEKALYMSNILKNNLKFNYFNFFFKYVNITWFYYEF